MQAHLLKLVEDQLCEDYKRVFKDVNYWWYGYYYTSDPIELRHTTLLCNPNGAFLFHTDERRMWRIRGEEIECVISNRSLPHPDYCIAVYDRKIVP
jgi:hypothetical protein